jgi:hypothetical protein
MVMSLIEDGPEELFCWDLTLGSDQMVRFPQSYSYTTHSGACHVFSSIEGMYVDFCSSPLSIPYHPIFESADTNQLSNRPSAECASDNKYPHPKLLGFVRRRLSGLERSWDLSVVSSSSLVFNLHILASDFQASGENQLPALSLSQNVLL